MVAALDWRPLPEVAWILAQVGTMDGANIEIREECGGVPQL